MATSLDVQGVGGGIRNRIVRREDCLSLNNLGSGRRKGLKKFLVLLVVSYIPAGVMLLLGNGPVPLVFVVSSVLFVPWFTAWAIIGMIYDVTGWKITDEWQSLFFVIAYILYIAAGLVFLKVDERRVRRISFAFYVVLVLLSIYGLAWFGRCFGG